ncbi:hypothetical protein CSE16_15855 [Solibacillus sp. R5-41]|uniref:ADP-ribosylglycohydrolase family protein n=1 Tax=Solibacillus sp. R5-41 TaxID=2048654 RepID=UPI000C12594E|nr:ADP-ribosylglycohydrolase family protein [Solibacillus sp. R5-41]ATP41414.1 hypothetical protein CSE16_15855 [Solibacillus sp. R5-41]
MFPIDYTEKVYASILAMNAGIRLGAPVEPIEWDTETIQDVFGDIRDYVKDYTVFSADDDANGPIFFLRALMDYAKDRPLEPQDVAKTWLNYMREGLGMIWWGGDQISTEHTAYLNLKKGIPAPQSGSIEINGEILAEQIGGQIFIDSFALLYPNNPTKAADYAEISASVSHDGDGLHGARFIAACIATAFTEKSINEIIEIGLSEIPATSTYAKVVHAVVDFHAKYPHDFRACRQYLEEEWGYDKYGGICHIIPNAGVCVLSLLYGEGDVSRTIEIATMCGWDTDCNAGNVGSIVGVLKGLDGIAPNYRKPINDAIVASSVSGYLNIVDLPTIAKQLALLGYRENNIVPPQALVESYKDEEIYFDFTLKGSTHGFKTSYPFKTFLRHTESVGYKQNGALEIFIDRMYKGDVSTVFYQSFYRREQFMDEKYAPNFSPTAYSGQTVSMKIIADQKRGSEIIISPYVRTTYSKEIIFIAEPFVVTDDWQHVEFLIPNTNGDLIEEVGIQIHSDSDRTDRAFGKIYLDEFHIYGTPSYSIDLNKQAVEFKSVTPFAHHRGKWTLENGVMAMESPDFTASFTGHYFMAHTVLKVAMEIKDGSNHQAIVRAKGVERYYSAGFECENTVAIVLNDDGQRNVLASAPFEWQKGETYELTVKAIGEEISLAIDGNLLLTAKDNRFETGMIGVCALKGGQCNYTGFSVNI